MSDYKLTIFIQIRDIKQYHNNSFFQLNRKITNDMSHII